MKLTQVFQITAPKAPTTSEPSGDASWRALLTHARRRWAWPPRADAVEFQETQPSVRDKAGPELR